MTPKTLQDHMKLVRHALECYCNDSLGNMTEKGQEYYEEGKAVDEALGALQHAVASIETEKDNREIIKRVNLDYLVVWSLKNHLEWPDETDCERSGCQCEDVAYYHDIECTVHPCTCPLLFWHNKFETWREAQAKYDEVLEAKNLYDAHIVVPIKSTEREEDN